MIEKTSRIKKSLRLLPLVAGFFAFLAIAFIVSWKFFENRMQEDVSNTNPTYFPVIVFTPEKSEAVLLDKLEQYKQNNQNYSFLVPDGKEDLINKQLREDQMRRHGKGTPRVTAKNIAEGKQLIEFEIVGDGLFLSRYEATDKDIKPLTFTLSGPLFVLLPCGTTLVFGFIGYLLLQFTLWSLRKTQNIEMI